MHETTFTVDPRLLRRARLRVTLSAAPSIPALAIFLVVLAVGMVLGPLADMLSACVFGILLGLLWPLHQLIRTPAWARQPLSVTMRFGESGVEWVSEAGDARWSWSAISRAYLSRDFLCLTFVGSSFGGSSFAYVPRSALTDEGYEYIVSAAESAGARVRRA